MKLFSHRAVLVAGALCLVIIGSGCSRNVSSVADTGEAERVAESAPDTSTTAESTESSPAESNKQIQWQATYDAALKMARETQKPIMIDFYADWCPPCKYLDSEIYTAPEVVTESENFVNLKVDTEKSVQLSAEYKISGLPTIVFLDASGREIHRTSGIDGRVDSFVNLMQTARAKATPTAA